MPTKAEQDELHTNCTWTWETQNGVYGYRVSSTANSNSIFLPAAGCRYLKGLSYVDSRGYYWSSSLYENSSNCAWYLYFDSSSVKWTEYDRDYGLCVRPVCQ